MAAARTSADAECTGGMSRGLAGLLRAAPARWRSLTAAELEAPGDDRDPPGSPHRPDPAGRARCGAVPGWSDHGGAAAAVPRPDRREHHRAAGGRCRRDGLPRCVRDPVAVTAGDGRSCQPRSVFPNSPATGRMDLDHTDPGTRRPTRPDRAGQPRPPDPYPSTARRPSAAGRSDNPTGHLPVAMTRRLDRPSPPTKAPSRSDTPTGLSSGAPCSGLILGAPRTSDPAHVRCLVASRRESPDIRSSCSATKPRTQAGSMRAYCRSAQPIALRMKNSRSARFGQDAVDQQLPVGRRRRTPIWLDDRGPAAPQVRIGRPGAHAWRRRRRSAGALDRSDPVDGDHVDVV